MDHESLMVFVRAQAKTLGGDFALLGSPFPFASAGFATGVQGAFQDESPIANILHAEPEDLDDMFLYVSYEPSEMDLGLAWRSKVGAIFWLEFSNTYRIYSVGDDGATWRTASTMASHYHSLLGDADWRGKFAAGVQGKDRRIADAMRIPRSGRPIGPGIALRLSLGLVQRRIAVQPRGQTATDNDFMRIVYALVSCGWNPPAPRAQRYIHVPRPFGNNIAGIIVDASSRIIAWGLNMKEVNKTFHAETMMILAYMRRHQVDRLPDGCTVYTSLECCYMCAGHIATLGRNIRVVYGQKDPNIAGDNALARGVNGCTQRASTLPYVGLLARAQGGQNIIDFLFGQDPNAPNRQVGTQHMFARPALDVQLFNELRRRTGRVEPIDTSAVRVEGLRFLNELKDIGLLHHLTV